MIRKSLPVLLAIVGSFAWPIHLWMQHLTASPGSVRVPADLIARATSGPVRVIVRLDVPTVPESSLRDQRAVAEQRAAIARAQDAALKALPDNVAAVTRFETIPGFAVTLDRAGLARLDEMPSVLSVVPDRLLAPSLTDTPATIRADALWAQGTEGSGWNVAILDTGVDKRHLFLTGRVVSEACYSTTDASRNLTSVCPLGAQASINVGSGVTWANCPSALSAACRHGTEIAGIAMGRNPLFSGVARSSGLISIQVYSQVSSGDLCGTTSGNATPPGPCLRALSSNVIQGLERVLALANSGIRVGAVNLSMGADGDRDGEFPGACDGADLSLAAAFQNLRAAGIPTVVAAGNIQSLTPQADSLNFPACFPQVIPVGSSSRDGTMISSFSKRSALLTLLAPGQSIFSSIPSAANATPPVPSLYAPGTGTSRSAAHVSGAWTLLKSRAPDASVDTVFQALSLTGDPVFDDQFTGLTFRSIKLDRAGGSLGPAGSPTSVVVNVTGTTITSSWEPPFDGSAPPGYRVEIIYVPTGAVVAIVNTGSQRSFITTLPIGSFRLRVVSITAAGPGAASNEIPFFVGAPPPTSAPLPPTFFRAEINGQTVALQWNMPQDSAVATTFVIDVGTISGSSNLGSFNTGSSALGVVATDVRPGIYYVRVRAVNGFGSSAPSNEIIINITGTGCSSPFAPTNLTATAVGTFVTLTWEQPVQSGAIVGYTIEAGTSPGLSNVAQIPTGISTIFSGTAAPGVYFVRVRAHNTCGVSPPSNEVFVIVQ